MSFHDSSDPATLTDANIPSGRAPGASPGLIALRTLVAVVVLAALIYGAFWAYASAQSPSAITHPTGEHTHFRLQIINAGTPVNFGADKFQTAFQAAVCTAGLPERPVHLHDHLDQFIHLHWAGITGGIVLKNFGWNLIGGPDDTLGYRTDHLPAITRVPILGHLLPQRPSGAQFYVYTGTAQNFQRRSTTDFLQQPLKTFLAGSPVTTAPKSSWWSRLVPSARAESMAGMDMSQSAAQSPEQLTTLNHVLGNVVMFVQASEPTQAQVKDRFLKLVPLPESTCGG